MNNLSQNDAMWTMSDMNPAEPLLDVATRRSNNLFTEVFYSSTRHHFTAATDTDSRATFLLCKRQLCVICFEQKRSFVQFIRSSQKRPFCAWESFWRNQWAVAHLEFRPMNAPQTNEARGTSIHHRNSEWIIIYELLEFVLWRSKFVLIFLRQICANKMREKMGKKLFKHAKALMFTWRGLGEIWSLREWEI